MLRPVSVSAGVHGYLYMWKVKPGEEVSEGQVLALFSVANRGVSRLSSPCAGVVRSCALEGGGQFDPDFPLCYLQPFPTPAPSSVLAVEDPGLSSSVVAVVAAPASSVPSMGAPTAVLSAPARRSTISPDLEELTFERSILSEEPVKLVKRSFLVRSDHLSSIRRLARLFRDTEGFSQMEVVRAALADFLSLPFDEQCQRLEANRQAERSKGLGVGPRLSSDE